MFFASVKCAKPVGTSDEEVISEGRAEVLQGTLIYDLGIVEPDDDPLSCLADEEDEAGRGGRRRPTGRALVEPVDPSLPVG